MEFTYSLSLFLVVQTSTAAVVVVVVLRKQCLHHRSVYPIDYSCILNLLNLMRDDFSLTFVKR